MANFKSKFNNDDIVNLHFPNNGILKKCKVFNVSFSKNGTARYDLKIPFDFIPNFDLKNSSLVSGEARIHSIKEWHLRDPLDAVSDRLLPDTADEE